MTEQPVNVNKVSWQELFPWTIIFKTLPIAAGLSVMVWAMIGVVATPMGWIVGEKIFITAEMRADDAFLKELADVNRSPYRAVFRATGSESSSIEVLGAKLSGPRLVFENMIRPFQALFRPDWSAREYLYLISGSLWSLLIWSFVGCAITRVCILRLTRDEAIGIDDAFDFAWDRYRDCASAVLMPLAGVAVLCVPLAFIGLLMGFDFGVMLVGILWFIVLALSAVIAFFLLGLMFGWPLIVSSISAEGQNSFDAVTRAFAYTYQRPLNYILYMIVAILFGGFCWLIVSSVTNGVVELSYWSTSWGANRFGVEGFDDSVTRIDVIKGIVDPIAQTDPAAITDQSIPPMEAEQPSVSSSLSTGRKIIGFWNGMARTVATAFIYGLFWCMATAIYLLLRYDVDETEMDEVFIIDEKRTYDLPTLKSDKHGIPQVQEPVATDKQAADQSPESPC